MRRVREAKPKRGHPKAPTKISCAGCWSAPEGATKISGADAPKAWASEAPIKMLQLFLSL